MSSKRNIRHNVKKGNVKIPYEPVDAVVSYLNDALEFELKTADSKKIRLDKLSAGEISEEQFNLEKEGEKKERKNLKERRKTILNKYIFPAMANLTVFFEGINRDPELRRKFDKVIQALLLGEYRETKRHDCVFYRFIRAALTVDQSTPLEDFRFALIDIIQREIWNLLGGLGTHKLNNDLLVNNVLVPDMGRAISWTNFFAAKAYDNISFDKDRRPVLF